MGEIKSTLDLIMEKYGGEAAPVALTDGQRREISEIRKTYQAKIAEARILLAGDENLPREIARIEREMERKLDRARSGSE
jgi:hypothetical protein